MIVVECFQHDPIDNIATCLSLRPRKLVFIGEQEALDDAIERYREIIERRKLPTSIVPEYVANDDVTEVVAILEGILKTADQGEECVIDLLGGDGVVLAAAGIVYERYKEQYPISLQRMNAFTGVAEDCDGDGEIEQLSSPKVTVRELIALYGGVSPDSHQPNEALGPQDIEPVWKAVIRDPGLWNRRVSALLEFEGSDGAVKNELCVQIDFGIVSRMVADYLDKRQRFDDLIKDLEQCGVISIANRTEGCFRYKYKTRFLRDCLNKAGNVLEYKTLFEARALQKDGRRVFSDARVGVHIDWDGIIHRQYPGGPKDTHNEIDVMLMNGLAPVFISCKNGDIKEVELYKLNTVAERFGGERARKMLIAADYNPDNADTKQSLEQRAKDMNVIFAPNVADFTAQDWCDFLLKAIVE